MSNGSGNTSLPFALGTSMSGVPNTPAFQKSIQTGITGGAGTQSFFAAQNAPNNFWQYLQTNGQAAWIESTTTGANPLPVWFAEQKSAMPDGTSNTLALTVIPTLNQDAISDPSSAQQFTFEGQTYNIVGMIEHTFSYNDAPLWYATVPIGIGTGIPAAIMANVVWQAVLKPIMANVVKGLVWVIQSALEAMDAAGIDGAAAAAARVAAISDGITVEDTTLYLVAGASAYFMMSVFIAAPIVISIIAHNTYHTAQVYNLTADYDFVWSNPVTDSGQLYIYPVQSADSTTADYLIPAMTETSIPGINPVMVATQATFGYANSNELEGFGYVLQFVVNQAGTQTQVGIVSVMFYVDLSGPNSLATSAGTSVQGVQAWYNANENQTANQFTSSSASNGIVDVYATFDFLQGQHPNSQGVNGFNYNSMVVFTDAT